MKGRIGRRNSKEMEGECRDNKGDMEGKSNGQVHGKCRGQEAEGAMSAD